MLFIYTPLCGTCKLANQMLHVADEALSDRSPNEIYECNINIYPRFAEKWKIESVPCLLFIKNGKVQERLYSFQSVDRIYQKLQLLIR
ncbi:thioredoxin family protein [Pseudalkalibacillus decolorationis]|uniref:thioredoxin family protein n=1 Tax=Pseudalkalibacillus decolorationis TaxID=163879 RepID=UPI00214906DD|nr:thioredoxin family protein [Pseudalkalibacillus decolorationis]